MAGGRSYNAPSVVEEMLTVSHGLCGTGRAFFFTDYRIGRPTREYNPNTRPLVLNGVVEEAWGRRHFTVNVDIRSDREWEKGFGRAEVAAQLELARSFATSRSGFAISQTQTSEVTESEEEPYGSADNLVAKEAYITFIFSGLCMVDGKKHIFEAEVELLTTTIRNTETGFTQKSDWVVSSDCKVTIKDERTFAPRSISQVPISLSA